MDDEQERLHCERAAYPWLPPGQARINLALAFASERADAAQHATRAAEKASQERIANVHSAAYAQVKQLEADLARVTDERDELLKISDDRNALSEEINRLHAEASRRIAELKRLTEERDSARVLAGLHQASLNEACAERDGWRAQHSQACEDIATQERLKANAYSELKLAAAGSAELLAAAAREVVSHWDEFGPEHGFDQAIAGLYREAIRVHEVPVPPLRACPIDPDPDLAEPQVTDGHGNPDPDGKYWLVTSRPDASEREHCERVATEHDQEMHDFRTGKRNDCLTLTGRLIRERADARRYGEHFERHVLRATFKERGDIRALLYNLGLQAPDPDEAERERADAAKRATEAERQRVLAWIAKHSSGGAGEKKIVAGIESGKAAK